MFKKILLASALTIAVATAGCGVTINVEKPDGTKYSYKRRGDQHLENVSFTTPEGASFNIGKQESTDLSAALNTLNHAINKLPGSP